MSSSESARKRPISTSQIQPAPRWSLEELKSIRAHAQAFRSEEALPHIRELARTFSSSQSGRSSTLSAEAGEIRRLIFRANPAARVIQADASMVRFRAPALSVLPRLPQGYGFKGGAARLALQAVLGRSTSGTAPRDLDLVRFGRTPSDQDQLVAQRFMPEDQRRGFGVELLAKLDEYMATRDITINEVILISGQVICSIACLRDTLRGILRPSAPAGIEPLVAVKLLRFKAEAHARGRELEIRGLGKPLGAGPFEIALHFSRVLQVSPAAAEAYVNECREWEIIPAEVEDATQLKQHLAALLPGGAPILKALAPEFSSLDQTRVRRRLMVG